MMLSREARWLVAAIQAVIGFEWLVSGADKVLSGTFPQGLAGALRDGIDGNPNGWYVHFLQTLLLPQSIFFGYLIESAEVLVGAMLVTGALLLVGHVRLPGEPQYRLQANLLGAAAVAALICAFLCVNFHFYMGDGLLPGLDPSHPFDEGVHLDTLMPPIALIVAVANLRLLEELAGVSLLDRGKVLLARMGMAPRVHEPQPARSKDATAS